jgi:hypothetical protein
MDSQKQGTRTKGEGKYYPAKEEIPYAIVAELHDSFLEGMDWWIEISDDDPVHKTRAVLKGRVTILREKYHETVVSYENCRFLEVSHRAIIGLRLSESQLSVSRTKGDHVYRLNEPFKCTFEVANTLKVDGHRPNKPS